MKMFIAAIAILMVGAVGLLIFLTRGPHITQFESLKEPRISQMSDQRMVVVTATGDPNIVGEQAFKLLFDVYFRTDGVKKSFTPPAPRARWPKPLDTPKAQWIGLYALPVPENTTQLPDNQPPPGLDIALTTWTYGTIAEVLHVGPYANEAPTVDRLMAFIRTEGYQVIGEHEEEYAKGPGMFGSRDPEDYLTIIRYRVEKAVAP